MRKLFLTLSNLFLIYATAILIQTTNMDMGLAVIFILGLFFFILFYKYQTVIRLMSTYKKTTIIFTVLALLFVGALETLILTSANTDPKKVTGKIDTILVLGGGTKNNKPGAVLKERLDQALAYATKHPDVTFIVSGGLGFRKTTSEGIIMKNYLVDNGIEPNRIVIEEKATSTHENLLYAKEMIQPDANVLIVTSDFHLFRTKMIAKRVGIEAEGLGSPLRISSIPQAHVREYMAIIKSYFTDR
ncbi:YdcF family protein [Fictibacillus nanhaiensis]|uniref:YdcF family protein n=1 Tax=Fictibacillus nanhaiensis TaxID=742169 RepID=UPI001C985862|nr:YdcF family protein [Fictibacillus nanhaiensis]MBY6037258.1 YdcF family protein [Fictibacillus nanhaiensis]